MKKKVILLGFMFSLFSLIFSVSALANTNYLNIGIKKIVEDNSKVSVNVSIPTVKSDDSIVNGVFESINSNIENFVNSAVKEANATQFGPKYEVSSNFQLPYNNGKLLSIVSTNYLNAGGAHGMSTLVPYNYDITTGKKLALSDMFADGFDYKSMINTTIKADIAKDKDTYFDQGADFKGITDNQGFYISKEGIVIFFQLYEIAPYAAGFRYFEIPMQSVQGKLKFDIQ